MNLKNKLINLYSEKRLIWLTIGVFFLIFCLRSLTKHFHFESMSWDLGIYDQQAWLYSRFAFPFKNTVRGMFLLSDHFSLSFLLLVPFYWIYSHAETLLVLQSLMVALAAYPLWVIAKYYIKSTLFSFVISVLYLTSVGVQSAIDFDFHLATIAVFFISFFIYYFWKRKLIPCLIFGALACLTKEDMPFYIACISIFFFLFVPVELKGKKIIKKIFYIFPSGFKKERILAAIIFILSLLYVIIILKFVMPHLPAGAKDNSYFSFTNLGKDYGEVAKTMITQPGFVWHQFADNPAKVNTAKIYFSGFAYLPLLAPHVLLVSLPFLMTKFLSDRVPQWYTSGQYGVVGMLELAFLTVIVFCYIKYLFPKRSKILISIISIALLLVGLSGNTKKEYTWLYTIFKSQSWSLGREYNNIRNLIAYLPKNASVASQNQIIPHISNRREVYLYMCPKCGVPADNPEYILLDTRFGAAFAPVEQSREGIKELIDSLIKTGNPPWQADPANYQLIKQEGTTYLFKNKMN